MIFVNKIKLLNFYLYLKKIRFFFLTKETGRNTSFYMLDLS